MTWEQKGVKKQVNAYNENILGFQTFECANQLSQIMTKLFFSLLKAYENRKSQGNLYVMAHL